MKVYFIRHGHAEHNTGFEKYGPFAYESFDYLYSKLTEKGKEQIQKIKIDDIIYRIYSSPLKRCIETSHILFGYSKTIYLHDGLIETQGAYPCNYRNPYHDYKYPLNRYNISHLNEIYIPSKINESMDKLKQRAEKTLNDIVEESKDYDAIAIVTHNDWLESLFGRKFLNGEVYVYNTSKN